MNAAKFLAVTEKIAVAPAVERYTPTLHCKRSNSGPKKEF